MSNGIVLKISFFHHWIAVPWRYFRQWPFVLDWLTYQLPPENWLCIGRSGHYHAFIIALLTKQNKKKTLTPNQRKTYTFRVKSIICGLFLVVFTTKRVTIKKNSKKKTITTNTPAQCNVIECDELVSNKNGHESCIGLRKNITATS